MPGLPPPGYLITTECGPDRGLWIYRTGNRYFVVHGTARRMGGDDGAALARLIAGPAAFMHRPLLPWVPIHPSLLPLDPRVKARPTEPADLPPGIPPRVLQYRRPVLP